MNKGAWTASDADSTVLAADATREEVVLQHHSGGAVFLGFGEAAVVGHGVCLSEFFPYLQVSDSRAQMAIHMKCGTGDAANGGFQTV